MSTEEYSTDSGYFFNKTFNFPLPNAQLSLLSRVPTKALLTLRMMRFLCNHLFNVIGRVAVVYNESSVFLPAYRDN